MLRHGVTEWNDLYKIQGATDIPLNADGVEMARQTGEYMKENGITFDAVYSSPLDRAYQSAKMVSGSGNIIKDERLREMTFGKQEGLSLQELKANDDIPFKCFKNAPSQYDVLVAAYDPEGESFEELINRATSFIKEVIEGKEASQETEGQKRRILISGHGALDQAILFYIRKRENIDEFWKGGLLPNCGIDVIEYDAASGEYTFAEEMAYYYSKELFDKSPKLLK